ncbi:MAG TPA: DUF1552 domain-containing protein [Polyangia bacterium]|jgi:hypothetical protein
MSTTSTSRRRALRTLAAIPFAAPLARAFAAADGGTPPPKRLVLLMQNNGTQQANFWPDSNLSSPILDQLFTGADGADNGLRAKTNIIKGMAVPLDANGTNGNQHDMGFARMFTGERLLSKAGLPWGGGPSVDQILANDWTVDSLTLAVLASNYEPRPKPGFDHRRSFSYIGPATLKYPLVDPLRVYQKLFGTSDGVDVRRRLLLRQSVLDAVSGNLNEIATKLGADDGRKLDYHLTAIRDVERRLSTTLAGSQTVCAMSPARPTDFLALDPGAESTVDSYVPDLMNNMIDLIAVAMACGLTRIATLQMGFCGGKWSFSWKGIDMNCHDDVAHLDTSDGGSSAENTARVVLINQYYATCVARLATALDAVPEAGGTMLDHTLVVWANEEGRGDHDQSNVPVVLLGLVGGGIPSGGRLIDEGTQPFNRLGCTVLNLMDHPVAGFGDQATCGSFAGLL